MNPPDRPLDRGRPASLSGLVRPHFRPDIEGLRAIAIFVVVAYHAGIPGFEGGYVGVDVFFVLSGYLITWFLVHEAVSTGEIDLVRFYGRRARRLLPALGLLLIVVVPAMAILYGPFEQRALAASAIATAAYGSNLYFAWTATDYLGTAAEENPLLHTWSLGVEEQFYLVWPLLVAIPLGALRRQRSRSVPGPLLLAMAAVAAASLLLSVGVTHWRQPWAFFLSPARAWEFAIGGLAALAPLARGAFGDGGAPPGRPQGGAPPRRAVGLVGTAGLFGILAATTVFDGETAFPGAAALLPVLSTAAVLWAGAARPDARFVAFLSFRPFQEMGRLSYSWYLWHWPILVFASLLLEELPISDRILLAFVSLLPAELSYRLVESPVRHSRALRRDRGRSLLMGGLVTIAGLALGLTWREASAEWASRPEQTRFTEVRDDLPSLYSSGCHLDFFATRPDLSRCVVGNDGGATSRVVLLGDSHAAQWYPALERLARQRSWRLWPMTKSACAPVAVRQFSPELGREYRECELWRDAALEEIDRIRPDLVVLAFSVRHSFSREQWVRGAEGILTRLGSASRHVVILEDTPWPDFDVPKCLARREWRPVLLDGGSCEITLHGDERARVFGELRQVAAGFSNVSLVDLTSVICPGSPCPPERDGILVYRDSHHLSATFAASLAEPLAKRIARAAGSSPPGVAAETTSRPADDLARPLLEPDGGRDPRQDGSGTVTPHRRPGDAEAADRTRQRAPAGHRRPRVELGDEPLRSIVDRRAGIAERLDGAADHRLQPLSGAPELLTRSRCVEAW